MPEPSETCMVEQILLVDDEEDLRWLIARFLRKEGIQVVEASNGNEALEIYRKEQPNIVITDVRMPGKNGVELLAELRELDPSLPVILISAVEDVATAVQAMKSGAYDFLTKPFDNERLLGLVKRALETVSLRAEIHRLKSGENLGPTAFGTSQPARELYKQARLVAGADTLSVLIQGESGTGKEVLAHAIHNLSKRRDKPFVAVDCGALPEALMESLLFGHKRGSFTGADKDREGIFLEADGGTLFLDELGNLPLRLQAKLLRSLQEREVLALGSDKAQSFDVRLLCASNSELEDMILHEQFRLDLYHRIAEFTIKIPPLRERNEDVLHFAALFLAEVSPELKKDTVEIGDAAKPLLLQHAWPGNLRELRNVLRRAALLCPANEIRAEDLALQPVFRDGHPLKEQVALAAAEIEKDWIRRILHESGGNKAEAARRLGVDYSTLHRKIKKYGLDAMAGLQ